MTDSLITQCPACQSLFRIQPSQLEAAQGMVSCGVCHEAFNALQYLYSDSEQSAASPPPVVAARASGNPEKASRRGIPLTEGSEVDDVEIDLQAIELYIEQYGTGDNSFSQSAPRKPFPPKRKTSQHRTEAVGKTTIAAFRPNRWSLLALVAFLALPGQYLWNTYFSANAGLVKEQKCTDSGCSTTIKTDLKQLRISNLSVKDDPSVNNAVQVSATLYNRAPYSQPFPVLEMRFTDNKGELIANRFFRSAEYLQSPLSNAPSQEPIHISLQLVSPSPEASGYELKIHRATP